MIRQSHTYKDTRTGCTVMAMESGDVARVREVIEVVAGVMGLGRESVVVPEFLEALPMRYHGDEVPT